MSAGKTEVAILMQIHLRELVDEPRQFEFAFHPQRKWRFDFAVPNMMLGIEIEGGLNVYGRRGADGERLAGRHTRGRGYQEDLDKYNAAAALGWTVFRFSIADVMCGKDVEVLKAWLAKKRG